MKNTVFNEFWFSLTKLWQADINHGLGNDYSLRGKIPTSFEEFSQVKLLILGKHLDLKPLSKFPNLEELHLSGWKNVDYDTLIQCQNLKLLGLDNADIKDIAFIKSLQNLKKLTISRTSITNLKPLTALPLLEKLDISYTEIQDWTPLAEIKKLGELSAMNCISPIDTTTISKLHNLKLLDIRGNKIENIYFMESLKKLNCLLGIDCENGEYEIIKTLPRLKQIGCSQAVFEIIKDWFVRKMYFNVDGKEYTLN
jgi:Leucine-rich repeat (LRR) protein